MRGDGPDDADAVQQPAFQIQVSPRNPSLALIPPNRTAWPRLARNAMEALARAAGSEAGPHVGAADAVICGLAVRGALTSPVPFDNAPQPETTMTASTRRGAKRRTLVVQSGELLASSRQTGGAKPCTRAHGAATNCCLNRRRDHKPADRAHAMCLNAICGGSVT